jgi:DNA-binding transcriptional LysR family regulator
MAYVNFLRTFANVYRHGSFGAAATYLNMTQPTVSKHIAALEQHLGRELFIRTPKGGKACIPTEIAKHLAIEILPHLDRIEDIMRSSRKSGQPADVIRLGGFYECIESHLCMTIAALVPHNIACVMQTDHQLDALRLLEMDALDFAIITHPYNSDTIESQKIHSENLLLVCRASAISNAFDLSDYVRHPFIYHTHHMPSVIAVFRHLQKIYPAISTGAKLHNYRLIKDLILTTDSFAFIPEQFIAEEIKRGAVCSAAADNINVTLTLYLAWNRAAAHKSRYSFVRDSLLNIDQPSLLFA